MGCDFTGLRNRFAKEYKQRAIDVQTSMLLEYAPIQLKKAYQNSTFRNRTYNLADSYIWVVYYKGIVKGSGYLWGGRRANVNSTYGTQSVNGRQLANQFISLYSSGEISGWEMVLAATAPYASNLETGESRTRQFYVISSIYDEVTSDFKGKAKINFIINS